MRMFNTTEAARYINERLPRKKPITSKAVQKIVRRGRFFPGAYNTIPGTRRGVWLIPQDELDKYIAYKLTRRPRKQNTTVFSATTGDGKTQPDV
jgi:hypothetical protein